MKTVQDSPTPAEAAPKLTAPQNLAVRYVDRPDCLETFSDSISSLFFDGQSLHVEFAVTRPDVSAAGAPTTALRYPVCRMVLPPAAAIDLINKMQQIGAAMAQSGFVKVTPPAS